MRLVKLSGAPVLTKVLAIIGSRDSGKTTVGEYLARRLAEKGFKVGAIKHVHTPDFSLDVEGKDTWRYRHAGAQVVACVAEGEITVIRAAEQDRSLSKVLSYMQADELDIVLLEGLKSESSQRTDVYKVVTAKRPEDLEETMKRLAPPILAVTGLIAKKALGRQLAGLPVVDIDTEGERLAELVQSKIRLKEAG